MFRNWFFKKPPLQGAPVSRRIKVYSAQTGYIYEYCYEGRRPAGGGDQRGNGFVFSVSADRKTWHPAEVLVSDAAIRSWEQAHGRALTSTERYAVAKMALFQAFDERPGPGHMKEGILVRAADVDAIIETLGL